jgi:hypothetical protein
VLAAQPEYQILPEEQTLNIGNVSEQELEAQLFPKQKGRV